MNKIIKEYTAPAAKVFEVSVSNNFLQGSMPDRGTLPSYEEEDLSSIWG